MSDFTVAVVTPTTGLKRCLNAIESVWKQSHPVHHVVVVDGRRFEQDYYENVEAEAEFIFQGKSPANYKRTVLQLPWNTGTVGEKRYWGHRIFAAMGLLVNEDIVCFLDDDNTYTETHVADHVKNIGENGLHFSYSLRNICDPSGKFLFQDNCESLGKWQVWNSNFYGQGNKDHFHVDTSAYAFTRQFLIEMGHNWHGGYAQDRRFFNHVRDDRRIRFDTTGKYTLNYNLGSTDTSASLDFFKAGNAVTLNKWMFVGYPWVKN